jgi:hypothetical protein
MLPEKGQVYLSQVLKDISKQSALVCSTSLSNMYDRSKKDKRETKNPANDEIKTKTVYQTNKREKRNRGTGSARERERFGSLLCAFLSSFTLKLVLKTQSLEEQS